MDPTNCLRKLVRGGQSHQPRSWPAISGLAIVSVGLCVMAAPENRAEQQDFFSVLVIEADRPDMPAYLRINAGFRSDLEVVDGLPVEVFIESCDRARVARKDFIEDFATFLAVKYSNQPPDVIVPIGPFAYRWVAEWREWLWPEVPLVFGFVDNKTLGFGGRFEGSTGWLIEFGHLETVRVALRLLPSARTMVIVGGPADRDPISGMFRDQLVAEFGDRLQIIDLTGLPMPEILDRVRRLPHDSFIMTTTMHVDGNGIPTDTPRVVEQLSVAANAPVFGILSTEHGKGIVGGELMDLDGGGRITAHLVRRVLEGEDPDSIDIEVLDVVRPMFDWRELDRWGMAEDQLPPGSVVDFRPRTLWDEHPGAILLTLAIITFQGFSILALLRSRHRRKVINRDLHRLGGRLITAQEDERQRVARELHDDVGQRLALLAIGLESPDACAQLAEIADKTQKLAHDVHVIAHHLQPPRLEGGGLVRELRAFCNEVNKRHELRVDCRLPESGVDLPADVALALYRVAQEAIQNAVKHSGADEVTVELGVSSRWASITVADGGRGVIRKRVEDGEGLGFAGMRERMRLVGGWLNIETSPGEGTTVSAWVPLGLGTQRNEGGPHGSSTRPAR